jgi:hypothetical protein
MSVILVSTRTSAVFAARLAGHLRVGLTEVECRPFPDGELYLRFALEDRFGLLGRDVVIAGATESQSSQDGRSSTWCRWPVSSPTWWPGW